MNHHNLRSPRVTLPPEIQLYILQFLAESNSSNFLRTRLSAYACVCRRWQWFVESRTFQHLTLGPHDTAIFSRYTYPERMRYVKHIVLEIPVRDDREIRHYYPTATDAPNNLIFSHAVWNLWVALAGWRNHRLTVELVVVSSFEKRVEENSYRDTRRALIRCLDQGSPVATLPDTQITQLRNFQNIPSDPSELEEWNCQKQRLLGTAPLEFNFDGLALEREARYPRRLARARVISEIIIRRRYFRNISPKALSLMFQASPYLEAIHLERWCYGQKDIDARWDTGMVLPTLGRDYRLMSHRLRMACVWDTTFCKAI